MNTKGKKPKRKVKMDYGDGSIYFVKSRNCYAGQVYLEIDGEKIRKSVYGKTERIVKDKIRELQIQAKAGAFKKVDKTTFYELAEKMIEEQARLLDVLNNNDINYSEIMLVSMFTGMRGGEICALNIEDIDFQNNCIIVNKTTSRGGDNSVIVNETKTEAGMRKVLINNDLAAFLKECIGERTGGSLFVSSNNKPVTTQQVNYYFWNTLKQYDIQDKSLQGKLTFHSLRHTFATRCIESGVPPKVLQKILGHKDISVTMNVYCDVFEKFEAAHLNAVDKYMKLNNIVLGKSETKTVKVA